MFDPSSEPKKKNPHLKPVADSGESEKQSGTGLYLFFFLLIIGGAFGAYHLIAGKEKSPIVIHPDGSATLAPHRQEKLDKELKEIDEATQYALIANADGYFPCFSCPDGSLSIFLYVGETWRYGTTRKGQNGRYPNENFGANNVTFFVQFVGTYSECLKMEKTKIFSYPLLPEARNRSMLLPRPPGNANDN